MSIKMQAIVLYNLVPNNVIRGIVRFYARNNIRRIENPGLQKRMNLLKVSPTTSIQDEIDFDELETDFMNVNQVHNNYEREMEQNREKEKFWIVRRKYFKENNINFLTWSDKEQISHLHNSNPEEWTVEKLSEGFPALPQTVKKILKAKWQPKNENKQKSHDQAVENNWKHLKEGKLDHLPQKVLQHIKKFTNRQPNSALNSMNLVIQRPKIKTGEFSSIIQNYNNLVSKRHEVEEDIELNNVKSIDNFQKYEFKKPAPSHVENLVTLKELREDIAENLESGRDVDEYDKMILKESPCEFPEKNNSPALTPDDFKIKNFVSESVEKNTKVMRNAEIRSSEILKYPEKIMIPKDKLKKGFTYKVNDCYYDDDGEFLYRVPGMY